MADFDLPPLGIQGGDLAGRELLRVQQGGEHLDHAGLDAAGGAGGDGEADQPGGGVREPGQGLVPGLAAPLAEHGVRFAQQHQLRPVRQGLDGLERDGLRAVLDPPHEMSAARGEAQPPVHGEEPAVGQVEDPGGERVLQLISQRVLPVVVAADRGGDPAAGRGAHVRRYPQLRLGPPGRHPERPGQLIVAEQLDGGAVDRGGFHPVPGRAGAQVRVAAGGVDLEDAPHRLLPEQDPGLGQRRPGRRDRARFHRQARHRERPGQHQVIALIGEQRADDDAHRGHLGGKRTVQLVPVPCLRHRRRDRPVREQLRDQARPAQLPEQVLPEPGPGHSLRQQLSRLRGLRLTSAVTSGNSGRRRNDHGKLGGQRSSPVRR